MIQQRALVAAERPSVVFDLATGWLREQRVLLLGAITLERDVAAVRDQAARDLWDTIACALVAAQRKRLEGPNVVPYVANSGHERLRRAPVSTPTRSARRA